MSVRAEMVAGRWFERRLGRTSRPELDAWADHLISGRTVQGMPALLSYGAHFPLVVYVDAARRRVNRPLLVLNGDRWPGGWGVTTRHQGIVRGLADSSGLEQVLAPFSALDAAGIDISSIEVRERRPDETLESFEPVSCDVDALIEKVRAGEFGWNEQNGARCANGAARDADNRVVSWNVCTRGYVYRSDGSGCFEDHDPAHEYGYLEGSHELRNVNGAWCAVIRTHRLGECLFSAETVHEPERGMIADRVRRRAVFVSSFDYNEPAPLYFLAEVPRSAGARTVEQAIDALAPRAVHAAIAQGRAVYRQGDVFAIETPLTDSEIRERTVSRARLTMWTRSARPKLGETGFVQPLTAAERRRWNRAARRRYLELRAAQWARANETGPQGSRSHSGWVAVRSANMRDRDRYRVHYGQNAKTAIERARTETMPRRLRPVDRETIRGAVSIYGTAHAATETVTARGGAVYLRGVLRHVPNLDPERGDTNRDHIPITLGDSATWFLAVRNTVPARADGRAVGGPLNGR